MSSFDLTSKNGFLRLEESARSKIKVSEEEYVLSDDPLSPNGNLLSQLDARYEDEVETIFESIRSNDPEQQSFFILAETIWQKWQQMTMSLDQLFPISALGVGVNERVKLGQGKVK